MDVIHTLEAHPINNVKAASVRSNMKDMYIPAGTDVRLINSLKYIKLISTTTYANKEPCYHRELKP